MTTPLLSAHVQYSQFYKFNNKSVLHKCTHMALWDKIKSQTEAVWKLICVYLKICDINYKRASAQLGQLELKISADWQSLACFSRQLKYQLTDVRLWLCCRLSGMSGWIQHVRATQGGFPTTDRCVKAESALENPAVSPPTRRCQLPPDKLWKWNVSLAQFKRQHQFLKHFKMFFLLRVIKILYWHFVFCFQQEE